MIGISPHKLTSPVIQDLQSNGKKISMIDAHWKWFENRMIKKRGSYDLKGIKYSVSDILYNHLSYTRKKIRAFVTAMPDDVEKMANPNGKDYNDFKSKEKKLRSEVEKRIKFIKKQDYLKKHPNAKKNIKIILSKSDYKKIDEETKKMILYAFGYDDFQDGVFKGKNGWCAYKFFDKMNVNVCTYCNQQYTFTIGDNNNKDGKPELDHFYPKADYPYLSCSLFNFIPSCHQCNNQKQDLFNTHCINGNSFNKAHPKIILSGSSTQKRAVILYPYMECFDDDNGFGKKKASFQICLNKNGEIPYKYDKIEITVQNNAVPNSIDDVKIKNTIEAFHLVKLYQLHQIELKDLLKRYRNYAFPKVKDIVKIFQKIGLAYPYNKTQLNFSKEFMVAYSKIFRNQILGLPLGVGDAVYPLKKFKQDVIKQLDDYYRNRIKIHK